MTSMQDQARQDVKLQDYTKLHILRFEVLLANAHYEGTR